EVDFAISIPLSIAFVATYIPGALFPFHCSITPACVIFSGSASILIKPSLIYFIKEGKRFSPCEYTPSKLFSAYILEQISALCSGNLYFNRTLLNSAFRSLNGTLMLNLKCKIKKVKYKRNCHFERSEKSATHIILRF